MPKSLNRPLPLLALGYGNTRVQQPETDMGRLRQKALRGQLQ